MEKVSKEYRGFYALSGQKNLHLSSPINTGIFRRNSMELRREIACHVLEIQR